MPEITNDRLLAEIKNLARNWENDVSSIRKRLDGINGFIADNTKRSIRNETSVKLICAFGGASLLAIIGILVTIIT